MFSIVLWQQVSSSLAFFQLYSVVSRVSKVHNSASSRFLVDYYEIWSSGRDYVIRLYLKIPEEVVSVILQSRFWVVYISFVRLVKLQLLAQFPVDKVAHPFMTSIISFSANLLHSLIMWLIISSLSPHNLHFLFCCILSILALIWLVFLALFCVSIRRDLVYYLLIESFSHQF